MDKVIVACARVILCTLTLATLAACNSSATKLDTDTPVAVNPTNPGQSDPTPQPGIPNSGNAAPLISGSPSGEIVVGQFFSFQPSATDADGDALTFAISSKPSWASFDRHTGRLSGTPDADDVGSHEDIVITVSDGSGSDTLPQFAINVVGQGTNELASATLAWTPPTQNTDGSALTNLRGYKVHYGTRSGHYEVSISIEAGLTRYTIDGLTPGKYFFAVTAVSGDGVESNFSGEASKTI